MLEHMLRGVPAAIFCLSAQAAGAATIYKCVDGGKTSYHDRPCGQGAVPLKVQAASAPAPETLQRLARERAMLQEIEDAHAERRQREEKQARESARTERAAAAQRRRCERLRLQRKWADEDSARAGRDEGERVRTKARRQAEVLAVECPA